MCFLGFVNKYRAPPGSRPSLVWYTQVIFTCVLAGLYLCMH